MYYFTVRYQKSQQLTITYLTMAISTETNSTALSYLSIIINKTVEMIAIKSLSLQSQQHSHTDTKKLVDFLRFYEGTAVIYVNREGCEWQVE